MNGKYMILTFCDYVVWIDTGLWLEPGVMRRDSSRGLCYRFWSCGWQTKIMGVQFYGSLLLFLLIS